MATIRPIHRSEAAEVRDLWNEMCETADAAAPGGWGRLSQESLERIRDNLERWPDHDDALCLVVEDGARLIGFVTASVTGHPVEPGLLGEVEELYVRPGPQEPDLKEDLARRVIAWARGRGAGTIQARVALAAPWTEPEIRFWNDLGFEHDTTVMSLYPDDPGC